MSDFFLLRHRVEADGGAASSCGGWYSHFPRAGKQRPEHLIPSAERLAAWLSSFIAYGFLISSCHVVSCPQSSPLVLCSLSAVLAGFLPQALEKRLWHCRTVLFAAHTIQCPSSRKLEGLSDLSGEAKAMPTNCTSKDMDSVRSC